MRLSAKAVVNFANVNNFQTENQWMIRAGEPNTLYFQLVDLDQNSLRYLAGIGVSNQPFQVSVTFPSIDNAKKFTVIAVQADPNDSSLWSVPLTAVQIPQSGNVQFTVAQGSTIRNFNVLNFLSVEYPTNDGCDGPLNDRGTFSFNPGTGGA